MLFLIALYYGWLRVRIGVRVSVGAVWRRLSSLVDGKVFGTKTTVISLAKLVWLGADARVGVDMAGW